MLFAWLFRQRAQAEDRSPLVVQLRGEVAYLRAQLAHEQERFDRREERYREELIAISNRHVAAELDWRRRPEPAGPRITAEGAVSGEPVDNVPAWMANQAYGGDHVEDMRAEVPNLGVTEEDLIEATIEADAQRREEERLAKVGHA